MAYKRNRAINLPAPYLKRIWLEPARITNREAYPFCLPLLRDEFELSFSKAITIIVGENGTGKSTLLEGIAVLAGYDEAGGGKGYMPVDHSDALEKMGGSLSAALRASWLPRITNGWFFRAESFFSVARYLDKAALDDPFGPATAGLPISFARRRLLALLRRALPAAGHLHLRRTGIRALAIAPDRVSETDAADGPDRPLPDHYGHPFACPDGLSKRDAAAADEIWAGAGDGTRDRPLQGPARILRRSGRIRAGGDRGVKVVG
ncbi:energy-coupling factor transporter ATP-binding protein EcfA2 [Bradyrhizobium sp. AZCC 1588]